MTLYEKEPHFTEHPEAFPERRVSHVDEVQTTGIKPLFRGTQFVWALLYIVETALLFRFILKLIGANPNAPFTAFVYALSYPFAAPFLGVVRSARALSSVFEWTTLLAMLVWWLVAWGIIRLLAMSRPVSTSEAHHHLEEQEPMNHTHTTV